MAYTAATCNCVARLPVRASACAALWSRKVIRRTLGGGYGGGGGCGLTGEGLFKGLEDAVAKTTCFGRSEGNLWLESCLLEIAIAEAARRLEVCASK